MKELTEQGINTCCSAMERVDAYFKSKGLPSPFEPENAEPETTEPEALAPGVVNALAGLKTALIEFKDVLKDADEAGLTPFLTEQNLNRIARVTTGILSPEPDAVTDDEEPEGIEQVENAARALITATGENPEPEIIDVTPEPVSDPGAMADAIVKGMAGILSTSESSRAERENPQPEITEPDPLKARIIGMMTESTGCDILDSGGAYGRGWQRNRQIPVDEWDKTPACSIEVYGTDAVIVTYDVYNYLTNFLSITEESERLNAIMRDIVNASGENSYIPDMEAFLGLKGIEIDGNGTHDIINTYNGDNILSQILQYAIFEMDDEPYILLQVHNGCDARGGYTHPQVYAIEWADYFYLASQDINASCECSDWWSDDAGGNYYKDGSCPSPDPNWEHDQDNNTITCRDCGKPVKFYVTESV